MSKLTDKQQIALTEENRLIIDAAQYVSDVNDEGNKALELIKRMPGGIMGNPQLVADIQHFRIKSLKAYNAALTSKHDLMETIFQDELLEVNIATELIIEIVKAAKDEGDNKFIDIDLFDGGNQR